MKEHGNPGSGWERLLQRALLAAAILIAAGATRVAAQEARVDSLTSNLARLTARLDSLELGVCPVAPCIFSW